MGQVNSDPRQIFIHLGNCLCHQHVPWERKMRVFTSIIAVLSFAGFAHADCGHRDFLGLKRSAHNLVEQAEILQRNQMFLIGYDARACYDGATELINYARNIEQALANGTSANWHGMAQWINAANSAMQNILRLDNCVTNSPEQGRRIQQELTLLSAQLVPAYTCEHCRGNSSATMIDSARAIGVIADMAEEQARLQMGLIGYDARACYDLATELTRAARSLETLFRQAPGDVNRCERNTVANALRNIDNIVGRMRKLNDCISERGRVNRYIKQNYDLLAQQWL